jgi:hypothetical protein
MAMIATLFLSALGYGLYSWHLEQPLEDRCRSTSNFVKNPPEFRKAFKKRLAQLSENPAVETLGWDLNPPIDFNCMSVFPMVRTTVIGEFTYHGGSQIWFLKSGTKQPDGRFLGDPYVPVFVLREDRDVKIEQFKSRYNPAFDPNTLSKHWSSFEMDFEGWISKQPPTNRGFPQGQLVFIRHIHNIREFDWRTGCVPVRDCLAPSQKVESKKYWSPE